MDINKELNELRLQETIIAYVESELVHHYEASRNLVYIFKLNVKPCFFALSTPLNCVTAQTTTNTANKPYRVKEKRKKALYLIANIEKVLSVA